MGVARYKPGVLYGIFVGAHEVILAHIQGLVQIEIPNERCDGVGRFDEENFPCEG